MSGSPREQFDILRRTAWSVTICVCCAVLSPALLPGSSTAAHAGEKYAFLVGVRDYQPTELQKLAHTEDDVEGLAQVLEETGFDKRKIFVLTQTRGAKRSDRLPTTAQIRRQFKSLLAIVNEDDLVVVAFAGHGLQFKGEEDNFFCPMDAIVSDRKTLIPFSEIYNQLDACQAKRKVVFVDACRNDPLAKGARSRQEVNLESETRPPVVEVPESLVVFFSCSAGQQAFEDQGLGHGVFFHFLIDGLRGKADQQDDGIVDLNELERYAKSQVPAYVLEKFGKRQQPELKGQYAGLLPLVRLDTPAALLGRGKGLLESGQIDEALKTLTRAVLGDNRNAAAVLHRGRAHHLLGNYDKAAADFTAAIELDPKSALAYVQRSETLLEKGDISAGLRDVATALEIDPRSDGAYANRSYARTQQGRFDEAIADANVAISFNEKNDIAYNNRALASAQKGDLPQAIRDLNKAISLRPKMAVYHVNRGFVKAAREDYDGAIEDYTEAIKVDRNSKLARLSRGNAYYDQSDFQRAISDYSAVIDIDADHIEARFARGDAQLELGRFAEAIEDYSEVIKRDPTHALAHNNRGLARLKQGQTQAATEDFRKAVQLDADNETFRANLQAVQ